MAKGIRFRGKVTGYNTLGKHRELPRGRHAAGLVKFLGEHPQAVGGILLHGGQQIRRLDEKIVAVR